VGIDTVILLDTHVWIWWTHGDTNLPPAMNAEIDRNEDGGIGVSAISCWEVAKLAEYGRLELPCGINEWMSEALAYPGIRVVPLSPEVAVESTRLPGSFHRDPADQLIVATARVYDVILFTLDARIRAYPHVRIFR
jgi:PIN domain nuclease of toxin-antitoxin system